MQTQYLHSVFDKRYRNRLLSELQQMIEVSGLDVNNIACCGVSGLIVASPLSINIDFNLTVIRKHNSSHSQFLVEGFPEDDYIIIDDCIETGSTIRSIMDNMKGNCKGIFLYRPILSKDNFYVPIWMIDWDTTCSEEELHSYYEFCNIEI